VPGSQPGAGTDWRPLRRAPPQIFITATNGSVTLWVAGLMVSFPPGGGEEFEGLAASPLNPSLDRDPSSLTRANTCVVMKPMDGASMT
jgi:hypothetical protein